MADSSPGHSTLDESIEVVTYNGTDYVVKDSNAVHTENVYNALDKAAAGFVLDARQGKALSDAIGNTYTKSEADALLDGKQDALTFDSVPTQGSLNPVTSGGVYDALDYTDALITLIAEPLNDEVFEIQAEIFRVSNTDDYYMDANGSNIRDVNYVTDKYAITPGTLLYLTLSEDCDYIWAFRDGQAFSSNVIGSVERFGGPLYVTVPTGATRLFVSRLKTTLSNTVFTAKSVVRENTQNIKKLEDEKQDILTFDVLPTEGSENPVTSGGVYSAITGNFDDLLPSMLNAENYVSLMKLWFKQNGAIAMTDFTALCDRWYTITRTGWTGGTRFYHASTSLVSDGTKIGDNADMVAVPSTNDTAGQDDYQDVPLFHCLDCNWVLDEDGKPHITAIEGVCGSFERYKPDKLVGVIQMAGWCKYVDDAENNTYTYMYTDDASAEGFAPLPEAVDLDGTVRSWVVHGKYLSGDDYGCYSGARPWAYNASHNTARTNYHTKWGNQYGGKTSADDAFLKLMFFLKYGSLTADGVLQGCVNYNYQYPVAVEETGVERVILTASQANNIKIGSTVMVGNPTAFSGSNLNIDRNQAGMRAKVDRKKVARKETLSSGNVAVYIDNGGVTFDTTASTITTTGDSPTYVSTSPWFTGTCDNVKGVDGSPSTPGNGSEPCILQGIECALGGYEVFSDTIIKYYKDTSGNYHLTYYICRDASKYSTGITADYDLVDYEVDCPASNSWQYISEHGRDDDLPEACFPHLIGSTSSQRTKDGMYILAASQSTYEYLSIGTLTTNVNNGGLSFVSAAADLGAGYWPVLARLSATGNRGIYNGGE